MLKMRNAIFFKALLTWVMIKNVDTSATTQTSFQLATLEPCIKAKECIYIVAELDLLHSGSKLLIQYGHTELKSL